MPYGIKYFNNEIRVVKADCLNPDKCNCSKSDNTQCKYDLGVAKSKVLKYYADRVRDVCSMDNEEFLKEFLLETRNIHTSQFDRE